MPALANARQERFCQLIRQGLPPYQAYPRAGYKRNSGAPYRLAEKVTIKRRLAELTRHIAVKTRVTVESLLQDIAEDRQQAKQLGQMSAALQASQLAAKLVGLMVERKETGAPGDFAGLSTATEVLDAVRRDLGDAIADALAKAIEPEEAPAVLATDSVPRDASEPLN